MLGNDQGTKHAPAKLANDIQSLMESLDEHGVYQVQKGRTTDDDDPPVADVISLGLVQLTNSQKSPLAEYNNTFQRLQARRRMQPVSVEGSSPSPGGLTPFSTTPTNPALDAPNPPLPIPSPNSEPAATIETDTSAQEVTDPEDECEQEFAALIHETESGVVEPQLSLEDMELDMDIFVGSEQESDDDSIISDWETEGEDDNIEY